MLSQISIIHYFHISNILSHGFVSHRAGCRAVARSPVVAYNALRVQPHHTTKSNIHGRSRRSVVGRQFVKLSCLGRYLLSVYVGEAAAVEIIIPFLLGSGCLDPI